MVVGRDGATKTSRMSEGIRYVHVSSLTHYVSMDFRTHHATNTENLFLRTSVLFWTSGDIYPGFQTQGQSLVCALLHLRAMDSKNSPLV